MSIAASRIEPYRRVLKPMKTAGRSGAGDKAAMRAVEQDEARKLALPMQRQRNAEAGEAGASRAHTRSSCSPGPENEAVSTLLAPNGAERRRCSRCGCRWTMVWNARLAL